MVVDDDLRSLQEIIESQEQGRSRIQALRLFSNIYGMDTGATITRDELRELLSSALLASEHIDEISAGSGFRLPHASFGAEVLEDVGYAFPESQDPMTLSYLTYSSLNYLITQKFANSGLLAEAALQRIPEIPQDLQTPDQFRFAVHKAALCFLAGKFPDVRAITNQANTQRIAQQMLGRVHVTELTSGLMLLRSLDNFAVFLQENNEEHLEAAFLDLERARKLGRNELLIGEMGEWFKSAFEVCSSNYAPRRLAGFQCLPKEYLQLLLSGSKSAFWLWPSQAGALEAGLFDCDRFAVSMPPSAGKTFLAELKIVQRIANTEKLAFYVVPLNALARQAQTELSNRLRRAPLRMNVRVLTGAYELSDEDLAAAGVQESVIITTPEKLDALIRNIDREEIKEMFDRADLFVFDECQNIGSGKRGVTLELLIERIRFLKPAAAILGSAAFFSNIEQFSGWLGDGSSHYVDDWRPTRRQVASWTKDNGLLIDRRWLVKDYSRSGDNSRDVTKIAIDLQRVYRNVLVVNTSRDSAEKSAESLAREVSKLDKPFLSGQETRRLQVLAEAIREEIHPQARLADYVGYGVAYHHARLPTKVKSQIEDYISDGTLKLVAATTTLAQGVNFPIRCIILPSIYIGGPNPMGALDIQNIVGRAGRAGISTTGQVIVLRNSERVKAADRFYGFDDYCFSPPPELLTVKSSLPTDTGTTINRGAFERFEALDSQILAFLGQGGFTSDNQVEKICQGSFLARQSPSDVAGLAGVVTSRLSQMEEGPRPLVQASSPFRLTDFGGVARRTGLGLTATTLIANEIEEALRSDPSIFATIRRGRDFDREKLKKLLGIMLFDPENLLDSFAIRAKSKDLFGVPISTLQQNVENFLSALSHDGEARDSIKATIWDADLEFLCRWMDGESYSDLFGFFLKPLKSKPTQVHIDRAIQDAVHAVERYSYLLDWSTHYTGLILEYLAIEKDSDPPSPELRNLGHYVRWGVNHPLSVFVREDLRWGSREEAIALGNLETPEVLYSPSKEMFRETLASAGEEVLVEILGSAEKANELLRRVG